MSIACRICIATVGIKGSDIASMPQTDEEHAQHMEAVHHIPVRRDNESEAECMGRFKREQPEAGGSNCKCPSCVNSRKFLHEHMGVRMFEDP